MSVYFKEARLESGFTQAPNQLLDDTRLSTAARMTWIMLAKYAWGKDRHSPGQESLGGLLGVTDRAVRGYMAELKDAGWLESERRGLGDTNHYFLLIPDSGGTVVPDGPEGEFRSVRTVSSDIQDNSKDNSSSTKKSSRGGNPVPVPEDVAAVFDEWVAVRSEHRGRKVTAVLGAARRKLIERAIESHGVEDVKLAVVGWRRSPHHVGENDAKAIYDSLELLLRNAGNIERFRDLELGARDAAARPLSPEEVRRAESMAAFEIANAAAEASGGYGHPEMGS